MALSRYVLTADVTVAAGTVSGGSFGTGSTPGTAWSENWPVTFLEGTAMLLDPAGELFAAIGSGNLRAYGQGTDDVGHAALSN
jgi:hypothetical protein